MTTPTILTTVEEMGFTLEEDAGGLRIEGPKHRLTPDLVAALKESKPAILAWLRDLETAETVPLNDMQLAYLLGRDGALDLGGVSSHVFHEFTGAWDLPQLEAALQRVIDRHDALRMRIDGDVARIMPAGRVRAQIPVKEVSGPETEAVLQAHRDEMNAQVMPVSRVPLVDLRAVRTPEATHLFVSHDGLIIDGLSMQVFFHELVTFYETPEADLPAPGVSFAELSRAMLPPADSPMAQRSRAFWNETAPSLPSAPALQLACDPEQIGVPVSERYTVRIPATVAKAFRTISGVQGLSASAALGAAFCEVLSRWSGGEDFTLNMTLANRAPIHPDAGRVIGNFTQPLPVAFRHDGATVKERASSFRGTLLEAIDHRFISGVEVVQTLARPGQGTLRLPVTFNCAIDGAPGPQIGNAMGRLGNRIGALSQTPQVWLNVFVTQSDAGFEIEIDAVRGLFPGRMIDDMAQAFERSIHALATPAGWAAETLEMLPERSRALRNRVNNTEAALPQSLLHDAFLHRAAETPDAVALMTDTQEITYGQLARRAAAIRDWLLGTGHPQGKLVAILMDKGWEQIAAAMGVLMAGAAYLPVASDLPGERIDEILESGEVAQVLVQPRTASLVPLRFAAEQVLGVVETMDAEPCLPPERTAQEQDALAYVLFTSGSTGKPKGVMVTHRNAVNLVTDINRRFALSPEDRLFGISALNFDLSVWDIFGALSAGAALVLPQETDKLSPEAWSRLAGARGVTVWNSVPAIVDLLMEAGLPADLRLVMMSGDKVPVPLARALNGVEGLTVMSLGGPTETTVWNVLHPVAGLPQDATRVPYGGPNDNNRLYVLDRLGRTCPDWVPGELHAAGAGVARGYWKDGERTDAAFFAHETLGERLYATGDVCLWREDGVLEIIGRTDFQVKINGLRVELGEIEAHLLTMPGIEQAVAFAAQGPEGMRLACAYVADEPLPTETLKERLSSALPAYMVPGVFRNVSSLPLTANGKVDRKSLIADLHDIGVGAQPSRMVDGDVECTLAEIWSSVLKTEVNDARAEFASLGGSSLAAVRIVAEIRRRFGRRLSVRDFTRAGTIEALAGQLAPDCSTSTAAE